MVVSNRSLRGQPDLICVVDGEVVEDVVYDDDVLVPLQQRASGGEVGVDDDACRWCRLQAGDHRHPSARAVRPVGGGVDEVDLMTRPGEGVEQVLGTLTHPLPLGPCWEIDHRSELTG